MERTQTGPVSRGLWTTATLVRYVDHHATAGVGHFPTEKTMEDSDKQRPLATRIVALEESLMHVEQLLTQLNEVACSIQDRLDKHDRTLAHLIEVTGQLQEGHDKKRTLEDDRPPHY